MNKIISILILSILFISHTAFAVFNNCSHYDTYCIKTKARLEEISRQLIESGQVTVGPTHKTVIQKPVIKTIVNPVITPKKKIIKPIIKEPIYRMCYEKTGVEMANSF